MFGRGNRWPGQAERYQQAQGQPRPPAVVNSAGQLQGLGIIDELDALALYLQEMRTTMDSIQRIDRNTETIKQLYGPLVIGGLLFVDGAVLYNASKKRR